MTCRPHTMSEDAWRESATKDVLFPDDLPGRGPVRVVGEPLEADQIETDSVEHGIVAELHETHAAEYVICPLALREEIAERWKNGSSTFEVLEAERGPKDHDPWEFEFRDPSEQ